MLIIDNQRIPNRYKQYFCHSSTVGNILIQNGDWSTEWWYRGVLLDVLPGREYDIDYVALRGSESTAWSTCSAAQIDIVWYCSPSNWFNTFKLPISVLIVAMSGEYVEAANVITNFEAGEVFDMGNNFGSETGTFTEDNFNKYENFNTIAWEFNGVWMYNLLGMLTALFIIIILTNCAWKLVTKRRKRSF